MMDQKKNGILLGWGPLIPAITALIVCVATFTSVRSMAAQNRERIIKLEVNYKETSDTIQENAITLAVIASQQDNMAKRLGITANTD